LAAAQIEMQQAHPLVVMMFWELVWLVTQPEAVRKTLAEELCKILAQETQTMPPTLPLFRPMLMHS
jgi:hypothetical protein